MRESIPAEYAREYMGRGLYHFLEKDLNESRDLIRRGREKGIDDDYFTYRLRMDELLSCHGSEGTFLFVDLKTRKRQEYAKKMIDRVGEQFCLSA